MTFTVVFLPRAKADVRSASIWYGVRSRAAEGKWRSQMLKVLTRLAPDPKLYPQAEEADDLGIDLREMLVGRRRGAVHRILFTIEDETVYVHRVRHASQDRLKAGDL